MPTIGVPTAAAMCVGPVSPDTISAAPRASATRSAIVVCGDMIAAPSARRDDLAASASSPGPHSTTDISPCRARSARRDRREARRRPALVRPRRAGVQQRVCGRRSLGARCAPRPNRRLRSETRAPAP